MLKGITLHSSHEATHTDVIMERIQENDRDESIRDLRFYNLPEREVPDIVADLLDRGLDAKYDRREGAVVVRLD